MKIVAYLLMQLGFLFLMTNQIAGTFFAPTFNQPTSK